jgi:hypothetical protein
MIDIDKMTDSEWIDYRNNKLESFHRARNVLKPTIGCAMCDVAENYTCFECEYFQIEESEE